VIYLDTHIVSWLYAGDINNLSTTVRQVIQENQLCISPMVMFELQMLYEVGKSIRTADKVYEALTEDIGLTIFEEPFHKIIHNSLKLNWTRDPFDRLIVAQAKTTKCPLITKDKMIRANFSGAIW
jgi:PIN domain nuclease of toxin-antitoxin system